MSVTKPLNASQLRLVENAKDFLKQHYASKRHHVACVLQCGDIQYQSLHLDTKGLDVCAEPIAISSALLDEQTEFSTIVAVLMDSASGEPYVISPCGNCRQILREYCPDVAVVVARDGDLLTVKAAELLPYPYG